MLTINEIETIVQAYCVPVESDVKYTDLDRVILNQLFKQTNLEVDEVQQVLNLYKNTKSKWLKAGLENVLLYGEFPVNIKEVTTPMQPSVWPTSVPLVYHQ